MIAALKIIIAILLAFTALGLACAVFIGRRRDAPADPFSKPFGEMPGFTGEQLRRIAPMPRHHGDPLRRSFTTPPGHGDWDWVPPPSRAKLRRPR